MLLRCRTTPGWKCASRTSRKRSAKSWNRWAVTATTCKTPCCTVRPEAIFGSSDGQKSAEPEIHKSYRPSSLVAPFISEDAGTGLRASPASGPLRTAMWLPGEGSWGGETLSFMVDVITTNLSKNYQNSWFYYVLPLDWRFFVPCRWVESWVPQPLFFALSPTFQNGISLFRTLLNSMWNTSNQGNIIRKKMNRGHMSSVFLRLQVSQKYLVGFASTWVFGAMNSSILQWLEDAEAPESCVITSQVLFGAFLVLRNSDLLVKSWFLTWRICFLQIHRSMAIVTGDITLAF